MALTIISSPARSITEMVEFKVSTLHTGAAQFVADVWDGAEA